MSLQSHLSSNHTTIGTRRQIMIFSATSRWSSHFSERARMEVSSGSGASIWSAWTTVNRSCNGNAREKHQPKVKVDCQLGDAVCGRATEKI